MPPIDPRLTSTPVRTTTPTTRPDPVLPAPAPAQPAPAPVNTGVSTFDRPVAAPTNTRGGVRDPSVGVRDGSVGVRDGSVGVRDGSVGLRDGSVGLRDGSVGLRDGSVGLRDSSVGQLGPERTAYEKAVKATLEKYLETPSYLRDDAPRRSSDPKAAVNGLPADLKSLLGPAVANGASKSAKVIENVVGSSLFKSLPAAEKANLAKVMSAAGEKGLVAFGAALEGTPELAKSTDREGKTLLQNLADLATQPLNAALYNGTTKQKILDDVLLQIANPDRVEQGTAPTCTVTSMQFELVAEEPAEYVRLMSDLTGPQGRAKMRGNSDLALAEGDGGTRDGRSISQTIFQTAAMEFGNGKTLDFVPSAHGSFDSTGAMVQQGLRPEQQTQVLRQLFGVNYRSERFQTEAEGAKVLEKLRGYDASSAQNRPIILQIDQGDFNHAVTFERVADKRVYFRDPYGELRSMPEDQFKTFVVGMNAPKDANIID